MPYFEQKRFDLGIWVDRYGTRNRTVSSKYDVNVWVAVVPVRDDETKPSIHLVEQLIRHTRQETGLLGGAKASFDLTLQVLVSRTVSHKVEPRSPSTFLSDGWSKRANKQLSPQTLGTRDTSLLSRHVLSSQRTRGMKLGLLGQPKYLVWARLVDLIYSRHSTRQKHRGAYIIPGIPIEYLVYRGSRGRLNKFPHTMEKI